MLYALNPTKIPDIAIYPLFLPTNFPEEPNKMGLYKRNKVWWIAISHQGKQIKRPTGTANRKLAEAILAKVTVNIIEGRFFDTLGVLLKEWGTTNNSSQSNDVLLAQGKVESKTTQHKPCVS